MTKNDDFLNLRPVLELKQKFNRKVRILIILNTFRDENDFNQCKSTNEIQKKLL